MNKRWSLILISLLLALLLAACGSDTAEEATPVKEEVAAPVEEAAESEIVYEAKMLASFKPLPASVPHEGYELSDELVDLGRMLYYEDRLSISQEMSCNSCHPLDAYGVDGVQFSPGHDGNPVGRNSPTVYNAALHLSQFWDGRAADVEEQAKGPILAGGEMGMPNPEYVLRVLDSIPGYLPLFEAAFPDDDDPLNYENVGTAIGAFERKLMTPGAFDDLLNGDDSALTDQEKHGLALFVNTGCTTCHYGTAVGGERYAVMGQVKPYPGLTDEGRVAVTGSSVDKYAFKVPSLLNISETSPYLHDGSITDLNELVSIMAEYQLAKELTTDEVTDIVAFLNVLTGEIPTEYIAVPEFPESGADTPAPYSYEESSEDAPAAEEVTADITPAMLSVFGVLPESVPADGYELSDELVDLGRILYYENRLSISQEMSCNSCHPLDNYGVDSLQFSPGHDGNPVGRNSPTVYNAALHLSQFWDGRAADVEEQAKGPILAGGEMGMPNSEYVLLVLNSIPDYLPLFESAFPNDSDPLNYDNVGTAIGAFERQLMTPSAFDTYLDGDEDALTDREKDGLLLFIQTGCTTCHYGTAVGGERYAVMGDAKPYPGITDEGRIAVTGSGVDEFAFKVPSLRNIADTAPYLHDGSITSLEEMVALMAEYQLDTMLSAMEVDDIVVFLNALTGEVDMDYIAIPEFPESGADTPAPYSYEETSSG